MHLPATIGLMTVSLVCSLALALPESPAKDLLLCATCIVVAFSILKGLSLDRLIRRVVPRG